MDNMELSKYFHSSRVEVMMRSQLHPADYNPRQITDEGRKFLKRSIKKYGVVGGIIANEATGYTIVGGHQKVAILDELNKYPDNDYSLRVEIINVDEKTEKEMNVALNNPNVGGEWNFDKLRAIVPDIDYKNAGLTDADLNFIGVDYLLQTEEENSLADDIESMMAPVTEMKEAEMAARKEGRKAIKAIQEETDKEAKVAHMKEVKQQVKENAMKKAQDMDAYVVLSFDSWDAKAAFCERFGYDPYMKFIKGEVFDGQIERVE